jgi:hypothetical protein
MIFFHYYISEYFYKIITPGNRVLDVDIITLPNMRTKRFAEPLQQKNTSIQAPTDNVNGLKPSKFYKYPIHRIQTNIF